MAKEPPKKRGGGSREDVRQLIAKKKYTQAIEILRRAIRIEDEAPPGRPTIMHRISR